jgi:hypothetical protein
MRTLRFLPPSDKTFVVRFCRDFSLGNSVEFLVPFRERPGKSQGVRGARVALGLAHRRHRSRAFPALTKRQFCLTKTLTMEYGKRPTLPGRFAGIHASTRDAASLSKHSPQRSSLHRQLVLRAPDPLLNTGPRCVGRSARTTSIRRTGHGDSSKRWSAVEFPPRNPGR